MVVGAEVGFVVVVGFVEVVGFVVLVDFAAGIAFAGSLGFISAVGFAAIVGFDSGVGFATGVGLIVGAGFSVGIGVGAGGGLAGAAVGGAVLEADAVELDEVGAPDGCDDTREDSGILGVVFVAATGASPIFFSVPVAATSSNILLVAGVTGAGSVALTSAFFVVVAGFAALVILVVVFVGFAAFATFSFFAATFFSPSAFAAFVDVDAFLVPVFLISSTPPTVPSISSAATFFGRPRPRLGTASLVAVADADIVPSAQLMLQNRELEC